MLAHNFRRKKNAYNRDTPLFLRHYVHNINAHRYLLMQHVNICDSRDV